VAGGAAAGVGAEKGELSASGVTSTDVAERWRVEHASARLKPRCLARVNGVLANHVLPALGRVRIEDLAASTSRDCGGIEGLGLR
jgi:hypothetical protein